MNAKWMQWAVCGVVATSMTCSASMAQEVKSDVKTTTTNIIVKAKGPIVIDGKLDEADWQLATVVSVNNIYGKKDAVSTEPRMTVRYLWDDGNLYIGYQVFDTNLIAKGSGEMQGPAKNQRPCLEISDAKQPIDVVEFFPILEDRNLFWETHHNALNQFNDVLCLVDLPAWQKARPAWAASKVYWVWQEFLQDEPDAAERAFASSVALTPRADGKPSTVNDDSDQDTGYTAELRFPWYGIGAPVAARSKEVGKPWKMAGRQITILAVFQNGDLTDRYHTSATNLTQNFFHLQVDKFPRYTITAD